MDNNNEDEKNYVHDGSNDYDNDYSNDSRRITDSDIIKEIISAPKETIYQLANRLVEEKVGDSLVLDPTVDTMIPKFDETEIRLGRVLGRGGFCIVQEIEKVKIPGMKKQQSGGGGSSIGSFLFRRSSNMEDVDVDAVSNNGSNYAYSDVGGNRKDDDDEEDKEEAAISRRPRQRQVSSKSAGGLHNSLTSIGGASAGTETNNDGGSDRLPRLSRMSLARLSRKKTVGGSVTGSRRRSRPFAFKQVNPELQYHIDRTNYMKGLVDLAMEAKFLANLDHPNIIGLCGISIFGASEFIIIDKLSMTLSQKFKDWMKIDRQCKGITGLFTGSKLKVEELNQSRYSVAIEIASACQYLHSRNIIFRDLKPDNIGFDSNGTVKLFDFGLAKELKKKDQVIVQQQQQSASFSSTTKDDDQDDNNEASVVVLYNLTGLTGAIRYMSPENALNKPYNLSSDVYSFSMILWFILALEPPFGFYTESMILDRVLKRGSRPAVFDSWPNHIKNLLKRSWNTNIQERPTFEEIGIQLKHVLNDDDDDDTGGIDNAATTATTTTVAAIPGTITESSERFSVAESSGL